MSSEMYQDNILDHYESPYHRGELAQPMLEYRDLNPLCGDEICVHANLDADGHIREAYFDGHGCVISQAAASMLMEAVEGKSLDDIKHMERQDVLDMLGVQLSMMRVKCAMLALRVLQKAIYGFEESGSTS